MHKNAILVAAVAACLSSGMALAQSGDYRGERGDRYQQQTQRQEYDRGDQNRYEQGHRGYDGRGYSRDDNRYSRDDNRRDYRADRHDRNEYRHHRQHRDFRRYDGYNGYNGYTGHGAGPRYDMRRGGYVSQEYRGSRYVVSDWRRHRGLYAPQRGYHWVQAGNDYLLVAVATGLIAQVLLN